MSASPHVAPPMGERPLVTVGLPAFQASSTVAAAVRSVLAQRLEDLELVVIDDGSTDGTLDIVRSVVDERISVVTDGQNRGLVARLNEVAALARGRYLARMDADDICHPERLRRQVEWLQGHPGCDVVATAAYVIDEGAHVIGTRHTFPLPRTPDAPLGHGLLLHPTVMARTGWFRSNPYDQEFERAEDKELWCRTWDPDRYHRIIEPLLFYREATRIRPTAYRLGCASDRRIIRRYGPSLESAQSVRRRLVRSGAVEAATLGLHAARLDRAALRLRRTAMSQEEVTVAQDLLDSLQRVPS